MESLERRVQRLERYVDLSHGSMSACEGVATVRRELSRVVRSNEHLSKLFQNLCNSSINFHLDKFMVLSGEELEIQRQAVYANLDQLTRVLQSLQKLESTLNTNTLHVDTSITQTIGKIQDQYTFLHGLELKYNRLLIRSIALLRNISQNDSLNTI
ncbi:unnamed protein product [Cyberlindnera jadinii]|uniref:Uncharacterized protein n=1 Tax=Cyberlindnera jadinii (strain ATCC 18201 / CBS 1600 / BCRC 20928 / JCM 3617 / NBRC 0987 / NRRL Y-1542) TaxID=983966 RepID=A0A0H5CBF6_CYBJN|nr:unnamed protein product [Cyberlindnera jadinii]